MNSHLMHCQCHLHTLQKMIVEITINWLPQFRKSIVFETELTKKMFILTIIFYSACTRLCNKLAFISLQFWRKINKILIIVSHLSAISSAVWHKTNNELLKCT